eukprot:GHVR01042473.1.p1 GENE.GHVR01042473.1~~GHVR01042473.1.p1  ORF type:complete len:274 (+),score=6.02 GHVR01042473.1:192-1013(+)
MQTTRNPKSKPKAKSNPKPESKGIYHNSFKDIQFRICPMCLVETLSLTKLLNSLFVGYQFKHTHSDKQENMSWAELLRSDNLKGYLKASHTRKVNYNNQCGTSPSPNSCASSKLEYKHLLEMSISYKKVDDFKFPNIEFPPGDLKIASDRVQNSDAFLQFLVDTLMELGFFTLPHLSPTSVSISHQPDKEFGEVPYASTIKSRPDSRFMISITKDGKTFNVSIHQGELKVGLSDGDYPQWIGDFINCLLEYMRHITPHDISSIEEIYYGVYAP